MNFCFRMTATLICLLMLSFGLNACLEKKEKKQAKLEVTEKNFSMVKDGKVSYSLNVAGKVKNVGEVDVKKVVVTGYCRSCKETMISNTWYVTQVVKREEQEDSIPYLSVGAEEDFSFNGIAYYYSQSSEPPQGLPENLEVLVESFEPAEE